MREGRIVEASPAREVIETPKEESARVFLSHFHNRG
jgi:polar amino acid transport system ATP-binding protein